MTSKVRNGANDSNTRPTRLLQSQLPYLSYPVVAIWSCELIPTKPTILTAVFTVVKRVLGYFGY